MESASPIIVVPMAGAGSRFAEQGYTGIKPLIEIRPGLPMIEAVVDSVGVSGDYIFIVQRAHRATTLVDPVLNRIRPGCLIVDIEGLTQGAACTVLEAKTLIDAQRPLIIVNSDNILDWDGQRQYTNWYSDDSDGMILTFTSEHPRYSYCALDPSGYVRRVAEKQVISSHATAGLYAWRHGSDFVGAAQEMIASNDRANGEFYVAPVYNWAIHAGAKIEIEPIRAMHGVGTPEELRAYQART